MALNDWLRVVQSSIVPSELPVMTFDPRRKCTWASPEYSAQMDRWLLERFGKQAVAFMFDPRAIGLPGAPQMVISPQHMAMLRGLPSTVTGEPT